MSKPVLTKNGAEFVHNPYLKPRLVDNVTYVPGLIGGRTVYVRKDSLKEEARK